MAGRDRVSTTSDGTAIPVESSGMAVLATEFRCRVIGYDETIWIAQKSLAKCT